MFNPVQFYEAGKQRSGTALVPVINADLARLFFTTRNGDAVVKWGDGIETNWTPQKNIDYTDGNLNRPSIAKNYSPNYSGDISVVFKQGLRDVYSFASYITTTGSSKVLNIQDFGTFIKQFPNLYSIFFREYAYQNITKKSTIKGNLADVPNSVERIMIREFEVKDATNGNVWFDLSTFTAQSNLKYFNFSGGDYGYTAHTNLKLIGDLSKLPTGCSFFNFFKCLTGSAITYTAGKVWAASFDTLSIPLPLTTAELDNLLIDMNNSITTKIGAGVIAIGGQRSPASDVHVASLQAKGFTVNVLRRYKILDLPFHNSFTDSGEMGMTMVAGGTANQPTFALSGRKAGEYCAVFNGSQSIKTTTNLPVNSDKVTIAFWMKTAQTSAGLFVELSENWSAAGTNAFAVFANGVTVNKMYIGEQTTNTVRNIRQSTADINDNTWKHIAVVINRANSTATKITLYINGVSAGTTAATNGTTTGNFVNNILYIGQRGGASLGFIGQLAYLKIYNYPFTAGEVSTLYNSEL